MGAAADTSGVPLPAAAAATSGSLLMHHEVNLLHSSSSSSNSSLPASTGSHGLATPATTSEFAAVHDWSSNKPGLGAHSQVAAADGDPAIGVLDGSSTPTSITYDWPSSFDGALPCLATPDAGNTPHGFWQGGAVLTLVSDEDDQDQRSDHHSSSRGSSSRQVAKLTFGTQQRARPLVKSWYRSKLLQLLKSSKGQQTADEPAMAVL
jgi:hypothetical protein